MSVKSRLEKLERAFGVGTPPRELYIPELRELAKLYRRCGEAPLPTHIRYIIGFCTPAEIRAGIEEMRKSSGGSPSEPESTGDAP